jgi:hypothetical protein
MPRDDESARECAEGNYIAQPSGGPSLHEMILENNIQANTQNLPLRVYVQINDPKLANINIKKPSALRQIHRLFQNQLFTQCNIEFPL